jgi:hypothetical protein
MKIGYIGSPRNLEEEIVKNAIIQMLTSLVGKNADMYVGPPNKALAEAVVGVKIQDMMEAALDMFDAIIITPGGPGAEKEARRFETHAKLFFCQHSSSTQPPPGWFRELRSAAEFDFNGNNGVFDFNSALETILDDGVLEMKCSTKKPLSFFIKSAQAFLKGVDAVEAKDGKEAKEAKPPVEEMKISGLGEAINAAVSAAVRAEAEGLATVAKVETLYPQMASSRGCAQIVITLKRK